MFVTLIVLIVLVRLLTSARARARLLRPLYRVCIGLKRHGPLCRDYPDLPGCDPTPTCQFES